jgi:hypothetical protein
MEGRFTEELNTFVGCDVSVQPLQGILPFPVPSLGLESIHPQDLPLPIVLNVERKACGLDHHGKIPTSRKTGGDVTAALDQMCCLHFKPPPLQLLRVSAEVWERAAGGCIIRNQRTRIKSLVLVPFAPP